MEKSSAECTVNDDNPRTFRKILLYLQTSLFLLYLMEKKTKATCIICRIESKGLGPFKSRYTRHSIAANMSLLVKKCIFIGKNMYRITQCKLKKNCSKLMLFGQ